MADWQRRLRRLVRDDPRLADELRRVLDEALIPALPPAAQDRVAQISIKATTSGMAEPPSSGRVRSTTTDRADALILTKESTTSS